jgi:UDP-N-acetylmuramate dehydrogenase
VVEIHAQVPLAPKTTFGVGGPARLFTEASSTEEVVFAVRAALDRGVPLLPLGGGSNIIVSDAGLDALVVHVRGGGVQFEPGGHARAAAGERWDTFVAACVERELAGVECLSGIPGNVGGTPIQNVGAYGQEVSETISRVTVVDLHTAELVELDAKDCAFGYRDSRFKHDWRGRWVVTEVHFALTPGGAPALRYAELTRSLAPNPDPTLSAVRARIIELRRAKSMVLDPTDENRRSVGSFFTNPVVPLERADAVHEIARTRGVADMPRFPSDDPSRVKLAAGWLIEQAGFARGTRFGRVGLSTRHALALVNLGDARASDVLHAALTIKRGVLDVFGVALRPEPELLGFDPEDTAELLSAQPKKK